MGTEPYTLSMLVMPDRANTLGVMHGGHMTSWMDMAAWVVATRAVAPDQTVFFKAIERLVWTGPVHAGEVCSVTATLESVGTTSLTLGLVATAEDLARGETREVCHATFTMVAAEDGRAVPVRLRGMRRGRRTNPPQTA